MNDVYQLHRSLDPIILKAVVRVLKLPGLEVARNHFQVDFLADIGIINLLRREYLSHGDILKVFDDYQSSRLEPESHRYESLLALTMIAIVGGVVSGVVSGVVLDAYQANKERISELLSSDVIELARALVEKNKTLRKFFGMDTEAITGDLEFLIRGYAARKMLQDAIITTKDYMDIIVWLKSDDAPDLACEATDIFLARFKDYESAFQFKNARNIVETSIAYAKGETLQFLDSKSVSVPNDPGLKSSHIIRGLPVAPGYALARAKAFERNRDPNRVDWTKYILCYLDTDSYPEDIAFIMDTPGVITVSGGKTSHVGVVCRGLRKPCILVEEVDLHRILASEEVELFGQDGVVLTGKLISKHRLFNA